MPKHSSKVTNTYTFWAEFIFLGLIVCLLVYLLLPYRNNAGTVQGITTLTPKVVVVPTPLPSPQLQAVNPVLEPNLTAKSIYIWNPETNTVILSKNPHLRVPPASTTKLMTAWVALKTYGSEAVVTVKDADQSVGQTAKLIAGEELTVESLVKAMLINSGNDAALALAQYHPQGYAYFVQLMNDEAQALGLTNTHFTNVSGLDEPDHFTSAYDLSHLSYYVVQNELINKVIQTKTEAITNVSKTHTHLLENTNELLWADNGVNGIKTGWTIPAGECLVTRVVRPEFPLFITVLGSQDRFGETKQLIDWAYQNFQSK